jgi:uncharacterized protein (TIGR03382 family)
VLVHYAASGVDAPPAADANPANGVPDFVEQVASIADAGLDGMLQRGFRAPLADDTVVGGGDSRIDIYLRNLMSADGNASNDSCAGARCIGYVIAENDYAGFGYPSVTEGIQSVVPHEVFHLIQKAYSSNQSATWAEGSAVWAVEELYGTGNSDFERFLPAFLTKTFRPFERPVSGIGDLYAYGAALWPYYLSHRFDAGAVVALWQACEDKEFIDAIEAALVPLGSGLEPAFIEFTRWNAFTGARAAGGPYPDASSWPMAPRENPLTSSSPSGRIFIEGLSARYVPVFMTDANTPRVAVTPTNGIRAAAWLVRDGEGLDAGVELTERNGVLSTTVSAMGGYTLVVTGLSQRTIATAVEVALTAPVAEPPPDDDDGGCSAGHGGANAAAVLVALAALIRRRRPAPRAVTR